MLYGIIFQKVKSFMGQVKRRVMLALKCAADKAYLIITLEGLVRFSEHKICLE